MNEMSEYGTCFCIPFLVQIERPLQRHGGRLEHNEEYCGSCYGSETVCWSSNVDNVDKFEITVRSLGYQSGQSKGLTCKSWHLISMSWNLQWEENQF